MRHFSLLPILDNIFEKNLFNNMIEYLQESNLLCENQSCFSHLVHKNVSFSQYFMKFMHHLIAILHVMLGLFFRCFTSI